MARLVQDGTTRHIQDGTDRLLQSDGAVTQTITPNGIATSTALGSPTLTATVTIAPSGIATGIALGAPTLTPGPVTITPTGIASGTALGAATLTPGAVTISPTGIASTGAVGVPNLGGPPQTIAPAGIPPTTSLGHAVVAHTRPAGTVAVFYFDVSGLGAELPRYLPEDRAKNTAGYRLMRHFAAPRMGGEAWLLTDHTFTTDQPTDTTTIAVHFRGGRTPISGQQAAYLLNAGQSVILPDQVTVWDPDIGLTWDEAAELTWADLAVFPWSVL